MKRVFWTIIWILTATVFASAQTTFYYPHIVNGVLGSFILKTTILLTNPASAGNASGTITFTQDSSDPAQAGSPFFITLTDENGTTTMSSTVTFSIPPFGTRKLVSDGMGASAAGFATVSATAGIVSGTAIFSQFDLSGNLVAEAGDANVMRRTGQGRRLWSWRRWWSRRRCFPRGGRRISARGAVQGRSGVLRRSS